MFTIQCPPYQYHRYLLAAVAIVVIGCAEQQPTSPAEILNHSYSIGDWDTTIRLCEQMLAEQPNDVELLKKLGQAHLATHDYTAAVDDFTKLIELQPDIADPYYGRENAYMGLGDQDLAYKDGQAGRKLDPLYESAYAYDMSNFVPQVELGSAPLPEDETAESDDTDETEDRDNDPPNDSIAENSNDDDSERQPNGEPNRTPYEETVFSDEAGFEPNETSRILANDPPPTDTPRADAGDIGIPKIPEIVMQDNAPKLNMNGAGPIAPNADGGLAELQDIRFPADPTQDTNELDDLSENIIIPQRLTTSLPTDELGNYRFSDAPAGRLSTGLQNNLRNAEGPTARSPSGIAITNSGPIATGLNAPSPDTVGGAANPITPTPGFVDPKFSNVPGLSGINGPPSGQIGFSGLPLPNGSTGLPTGPVPNGAIPNGAGRTGFTPNGTKFRGNPIFGQGNQAVISTSIPGFPAPNSVAPPAKPSGPQPQISTSLSDTVLQNRLQGNSTQPALKLRSIQP